MFATFNKNLPELLKKERQQTLIEPKLYIIKH